MWLPLQLVLEFLGRSLVWRAVMASFGAVAALALSAAIRSFLGGVAFGAATFSTNIVALRVGAADLAAASLIAGMVGLAGGFGPARSRIAALRFAEGKKDEGYAAIDEVLANPQRYAYPACAMTVRFSAMMRLAD